jgi:MFS family permease
VSPSDRSRTGDAGGERKRSADRALLGTAAFLRALATGLIGVLLGVHLATLGLDANWIGIIVSAGLAGAATASLIVTWLGARVGYRSTLITLALLGAAGGIGLLAGPHPWILAAGAFVGMVNGMGRDRGAALILEQALLPSTVGDAKRTLAFAQYNVLQDLGHALGALLAGLPALLVAKGLESSARASDVTILLYALLSLLPLGAYLLLSREISAPQREVVRLSPESRRILWRISSLFAIDSLAGGFLTTALLSYFFHARFGVGVEVIGPLFFAARVANALSHLAAAWLARRIGLVNTMVFTHIPSSLLLITVAYAPSFPVAAALFLLRESLVEMDVPTRQSYVMAVVQPGERAIASGVTHLVRMGAWAVAPAFAGLLMSETSLMIPLVIGAAMKVSYDLLLWRVFRHVRPPEEPAAGRRAE